RWPNGFICPACGARAVAWHKTRGRLICSASRTSSRYRSCNRRRPYRLI
ncbi:MAG: transposase, partial [Planctomycetes bacterium]|nr:transposase [Planctomycetota bacterium]